MERTCHLTSLKTFHTTPTKTLTTYHALLANFHNLQINDCPRFHTIKNPSTKQHQSTKKPSTTADINTFSNFLDTSQPKLQTLGEKNRKREIIWYFWYSPPFSKNVSTYMGCTFLKLLEKEFTKEHVLHKIFNRNSIKISYSCTPNLKQNINGHNKFWFTQ